jgi:hypothetical protein
LGYTMADPNLEALEVSNFACKFVDGRHDARMLPAEQNNAC